MIPVGSIRKRTLSRVARRENPQKSRSPSSAAGNVTSSKMLGGRDLPLGHAPDNDSQHGRGPCRSTAWRDPLGAWRSMTQRTRARLAGLAAGFGVLNSAGKPEECGSDNPGLRSKPFWIVCLQRQPVLRETGSCGSKDLSLPVDCQDSFPVQCAQIRVISSFSPRWSAQVGDGA